MNFEPMTVSSTHSYGNRKFHLSMYFKTGVFKYVIKNYYYCTWVSLGGQNPPQTSRVLFEKKVCPLLGPFAGVGVCRWTEIFLISNR